MVLWECGMDKDSSDFAAIPFPYEILDDEAARISNLVQAVQQKSAQCGERVAQELFTWAEACSEQGRRDEAEFLYLHCINTCQRQYGLQLQYPVAFTSLRQYAQALLQHARQPDEPITSAPFEQQFGAAA
jgi:hypothetical protein